MQFLSLSSTDPALNLALEECLLQWLPADHPGLFLLWQNAPSVIVGRHQVTLDEIDADFVRRRGLPVVRRMTGGGAVYHAPPPESLRTTRMPRSRTASSLISAIVF